MDEHPDVPGRTDKSSGGSGLPARADRGGVERGAKRAGAALVLAAVALIVLLVVFGLFTDVF